VRTGVAALFRALPQLRPAVEKLLWRGFYEVASLGRRSIGATVMNYGYAPAGAEAADRSAGSDRLGLALYSLVADGAELSGLDVLEVGSGRGGGAAHLFATCSPRRMVGLDLARSAIERSRSEHGRPGLEFVTGDAERLPFADGSFDAVISVESSHCYPDVAQFLREVHRVLRPGGRLLLADFRRTPAGEPAQAPEDDLRRFYEQITATGFRTLEEQTITPEVLRALRIGTPAVRGTDRTASPGAPTPLRARVLRRRGQRRLPRVRGREPDLPTVRAGPQLMRLRPARGPHDVPLTSQGGWRA